MRRRSQAGFWPLTSIGPWETMVIDIATREMLSDVLPVPLQTTSPSLAEPRTMSPEFVRLPMLQVSPGRTSAMLLPNVVSAASLR